MSAGIFPWLFLIPPVVIALAGIFVVLFRRTELGRARRRYVLDKYDLNDPDAHEPDEPHEPPTEDESTDEKPT